MRWLVSSTLATVMIAVASCGGGSAGDDSTAPESTGEPKPSQPISAAVPAFNRAIAADSCESYQPQVFSLIRQRPPGSPATPTECAPGAKLPDAQLQEQHFDTSREYGTGAIIEGPGQGGKKEGAIWVLDGDRHFHFTGISGPVPEQIGTTSPAAPAARTAQAFVKATRDGDCAAMEPLLSPSGRLTVSGGGAKAACKTILAGHFLAPALAKGPLPKVESLGATRDFAFVGLPTRDAYFTIVLSDAGLSQMKVSDTLPSTPVDIPG